MGSGHVHYGALESMHKCAITGMSVFCPLVLEDFSSSNEDTTAYVSCKVVATCWHVSEHSSSVVLRNSMLGCEPWYMYVCMYVCLMSWGPTGGQQTEFCSCKFSHSKFYF